MISTLKELQDANRKGYTASMKDIEELLGVSTRTVKTLLRDAPAVHIAEKLYWRLKKSGYAQRKLYNQDEVLEYLIKKGKLKMKYHDPRHNFTDNEGVHEVDAGQMIKRIKEIGHLVAISQTMKEIIIEDFRYTPFIVDNAGKTLYSHEDDETDIRGEDDIYNEQDVAKYTDMIKRGFYIRFEIGKGTVKYIHSMRMVNKNNLQDIVAMTIMRYEAECKP